MKSSPHNKDRSASPPKVLECVCGSSYQDKRYGKDMRLHNPKASTNGTLWRCTVCGRER